MKKHFIIILYIIFPVLTRTIFIHYKTWGNVKFALAFSRVLW